MPNPLDCPFCGYDCTGIPSGICPECGRPVFRFTQRAQAVMEQANEHAKRLLARPKSIADKMRNWFVGGTGLYGIGCSHILSGILTGPRGVAYHALAKHIPDPASLLPELHSLDLPFIRQVLSPDVRLPLRPTAQSIVKTAIDEASRLGHDWVGTEHLLLGICRDGAPSTQACLQRRGISRNSIEDFIVSNVERIKESESTN